MPDSRYGRLFTEADVVRLMTYTAEQVYDEKDAAEIIGRLDAQGGLTFPADEPLFVLRASDANAMGALDEYDRDLLSFITELGDEAYDAVRGRATEALRSFDRWQRANPERVKVPGR